MTVSHDHPLSISRSSSALPPSTRLCARGAAIVLRPRQLVSFDQLVVLDLNGGRLEGTGQDALAFAHAMFSARVSRISKSTGLIATTYVGGGAPRGLSLYQSVWTSLPKEEQDRISADRVIRP